MDNSRCLFIKDNDGISTEILHLPSSCVQYIEGILVSKGMIKDRVEQLAYDVRASFGQNTITILCLLKGAFRYARDLTKALDRLDVPGLVKPYEVEFIKVKSYTNESNEGNVEITGLDMSLLENKHVLVLDDLCDSGRSLKALMDRLSQVNFSMLKTTTFAFKRTSRNVGFEPDFIGVSLPDEWLVGYSMDYNQQFRNLEHICFINDHAKEAFRE